MAEILVDLDLPRRQPYGEAAGIQHDGPSPRGSTYWRRLQLCPREHFLAAELGWVPEQNEPALDLGLLWHGALEVYYRALHAQQSGYALERVPQWYAFNFIQRFRDAAGWASFYEAVSRMLDVYVERWERYDQQYWQILAVEYTCGWTRATHPQIAQELGFELTTRLDLLLIDHSMGRPFTRHAEHKSAYALDPVMVSGYSQDDQVLGQCFLGRHWVDWVAHGYPPYLGALVNITTKGKTPKCERIPVQPSDEQLDAWATNKRFWQASADFYQAYDGYPRNYANCTRRFGRCAYFDLCRTTSTEGVVELRRRDAENQLVPGFQRRATW